jgi:hypothetical protein
MAKHAARPDHQRLKVFVGQWRTEGQTIAATGESSLPIHSSDIYEWLPGEFFVVHRWDGTVGEAKAAGIEIIGYDAVHRNYRTHFFDNTGTAGSEELTVHDRTWTWLGKQVMGSAWHRCTSVVSDDGQTMNARHERSDDGKNWTAWMDVTLRRTVDASASRDSVEREQPMIG